MMEIGIPSYDAIGDGRIARAVTGGPRPQSVAKAFWDRLVGLGGERQLIRGEYMRALGTSYRVGDRECPAAIEYWDMGKEEGKRYCFWLFAPGLDPETGDWADVEYAVTLGRESDWVAPGDYRLLVHAPEGAPDSDMSDTLHAFESWIGRVA